MARLIECHPAVLRALTWSQFKDFMDQGYLHHLGTVIRFVSGRSEKILDDATYVHTRRSSFNENGDVVSHHDVPGPKLGVANLKFRASPTAFAAIDHLNRFQAECQHRGARVFYSHPPYEQRSFEKNRTTIFKLDALLKERLKIPMLDTVEDMVFPTDHFFDTEYHLTLPGKLKRAERVAENLGRAIKQPR